MVNITNHYRNSNENNNEIRMAMIKKKKRKITSVGKNVEKLEPLCTVGGNVK